MKKFKLVWFFPIGKKPYQFIINKQKGSKQDYCFGYVTNNNIYTVCLHIFYYKLVWFFPRKIERTLAQSKNRLNSRFDSLGHFDQHRKPKFNM